MRVSSSQSTWLQTFHRVTTDRQLLDQILKNLLANAFKFTEHGRVELRIERAPAACVPQRIAAACPGRRLRSRSRIRALAFLRGSSRKIFEAFAGGYPSRADSAERAGAHHQPRIRPNPRRRRRGSKHAERGEHLHAVSAAAARRTPGVQRSRSRALRRRATTPSPQTPRLRRGYEGLAGKTILVVEDDARNLYSVTSLQRFKVHVIRRTVPGRHSRACVSTRTSISCSWTS